VLVVGVGGVLVGGFPYPVWEYGERGCGLRWVEVSESARRRGGRYRCTPGETAGRTEGARASGRSRARVLEIPGGRRAGAFSAKREETNQKRNETGGRGRCSTLGWRYARNCGIFAADTVLLRLLCVLFSRCLLFWRFLCCVPFLRSTAVVSVRPGGVLLAAVGGCDGCRPAGRRTGRNSLRSGTTA